MDFLSTDSEELLQRYQILEPPTQTRRLGLAGIANIYHLAKAGYKEDVLETLHYIDDHMYVVSAFSGACEGGHIELVELLIQKGIYNWSRGMWGACYENRMEIALLLIEKIKSSGDSCDWDSALGGACWEGHKDMALLMIKNGATDLGLGLRWACTNGNKELISLIVQKMKSTGSIKKCRRCNKFPNEHF
jgi:ankyrin repeat protein